MKLTFGVEIQEVLFLIVRYGFKEIQNFLVVLCRNLNVLFKVCDEVFKHMSVISVIKLYAHVSYSEIPLQRVCEAGCLDKFTNNFTLKRGINGYKSYQLMTIYDVRSQKKTFSQALKR